ncbi:extended synaptotagmin-1-like [Tigriopus californicus]|uniref:extended synaptotagmin-1-like n=1 Tax=Tigriopus californicus TaxID=6832 RepID=UPI0027DA4E3B|nr:extended synaptotagmin-1-like [Tigriopus californicus]
MRLFQGAFGEFSDHASQNIVWLPYLGGLISIIFSHWLFGTVLPIILVWIILQDWSRFLLPLRKVIFSNITEPCEDALDVNPAFACEPDSETVGWVNNILERFWTNSLRPFALDDVSKIVERDLFHGFLNKLRLFRHFNVHAFLIHFDPGEIPPILTFIRCSTSEVNLLNHGYESLTFDLGLAVDLHPKVETWIGGSMKFGLKRFRLAAPLIFRFSPMLKDFKLVGQLEISLKRQIAMDWEFQYLLRCLNLTFVKRIVHAILHILGSFVIQPRKLIFPMLVDPKVICDHLQMQRIPIALLRVEIEKGKSLKVSDCPLICPWMGLADPYCVVRLGSKYHASHKIRRSLNPVWNFQCEFPVTGKDLHDKEELKFVVKDFDWGFCHEDDDLGFMNLDLCAILDQEGVEKWINLHSGGKGMLKISLSVHKLRNFPFHKILTNSSSWSGTCQICPDWSQAVLVLLLHEVQMSHSFRPMMIIQASGRDPVASSMGEISENWEFSEEFVIPIHDVLRDTIELSLVDFDASSGVFSRSKRGLRTVKNVLISVEDPRNGKKLEKEMHKTMGKRAMRVYEFQGIKQVITMDSQEGLYKCILKAKLYSLANN